MSDYQDQFQSPIRADRDDDRARPKSAGRGGDSQPGAGGRFPNTLVTIVLAVVLAGTLGLVWMQSQEIAGLEKRFNDLDTLIKSTDESLSQSGTALSLRIKEQGDTLDKHWSEIKKLWGVSYDRNRKAIAESQKAAEGAGANAKQALSSVKQQQAALAKLQAGLEQLDASLKDVSATVSNLSSSTLATSLQLEEMDGKLAEIAGLKKELSSIKTRTASTENALKAIDVYRSQVNQQLNQLRQAIQQQP